MVIGRKRNCDRSIEGRTDVGEGTTKAYKEERAKARNNHRGSCNRRRVCEGREFMKEELEIE